MNDLIKTIKERFWSKVDIKGEDDCWNWIANIDTPGYGAFKYNKRKMDSNRVAWILTYGEIPDGLWVLHKCKGNRLCCNPKHLYLGTRSDNMKDAVRDGTASILNCRRVFGEESGQAKMTNVFVSKIKEEILSGTRGVDICKKYNLDKGTVSSIKHEKTWKNILPRINNCT